MWYVGLQTRRKIRRNVFILILRMHIYIYTHFYSYIYIIYFIILIYIYSYIYVYIYTFLFIYIYTYIHIYIYTHVTYTPLLCEHYLAYLIKPLSLCLPMKNVCTPSNIWLAHGGFTQMRYLKWPAYTAGKIQFSILSSLKKGTE